MELRTGKRAEDRALREPRIGGSVWPRQSCPACTLRTAALAMDRDCWHCKYADFHLREPVALDVGICCWPKIQLD